MLRSTMTKATLVALFASTMLAAFASAAAAAPPTNDDFDTPVTVSALPYTNSQDTTDATTAPDDPVCGIFGSSHTVWYRFTPSSAVAVLADTFGSNYDTTLSVYTGT